jgi:hypothetical protein
MNGGSLLFEYAWASPDHQGHLMRSRNLIVVAVGATIFLASQQTALAELTAAESAIVRSIGINPKIVNENMTPAQERHLHEEFMRARTSQEQEQTIVKLMKEYSRVWLEQPLREKLGVPSR